MYCNVKINIVKALIELKLFFFYELFLYIHVPHVLYFVEQNFSALTLCAPRGLLSPIEENAI